MWKNRIRRLCGISLSVMLVVSAIARGQDPIVYYPLDELGATVVDASGNGHNGTPHGALQLKADGVLRGCFEFNGSDARIEMTRPIQDEFTLAGWIKTSTPGLELGTMAYNGSGLFWSDVPGPANDFVVAALGTKLSFNVGNPNNTVTSNEDIVTGEWVHVAAVRETTAPAISLYINGALDNRIDHPNGDALDAQSLLVIGANPLDGRYYEGLIDEVKIFDAALSEVGIQRAMQVDRGSAGLPNPEDGATDIPRDVVLSWTAGAYAATHDVYLCTVFEDVNEASRTDPREVLVAEGLSTSLYEPAAALGYDQTYYWRVDEVNAPPDMTIYKGEPWRFTTEPYSYPLDGQKIQASASSSDGADMGPEKTIDGSGLDPNDQHSTDAADMWLGDSTPQPTWIQYEFDQSYRLDQMRVWNSNQPTESAVGFGAKDVTVEYSGDGETWMTLGEFEFAQAPGEETYETDSAVPFGGVVAQYVRLTIHSNWGGLLAKYGLSEVRFLYIPMRARYPEPTTGAADVSPQTTLSWRAGREAALHEVYVGSDANDLAVADVVSASGYDTTPLDLHLGMTYYWRVDEVNDAASPNSWQGPTWSFSTPAYLIVDDFERYNDDELIYETWLDGFNVTTNGSQVGHYNRPYAEQTTVHSGQQSMPFYYDNTGGATSSEATLSFDVAQDWSRSGIETLTLFFYGTGGNTGQPHVKINGQKVVYTGVADAISTPWWRQWNIDLGSVGIDLENVTELTLGVGGSGSGVLYVDDIRLYRSAPTPPREEVWLQAEAADSITEPMTLYTGDPEAMGGAYIGTEPTVPNSSGQPPSPDGTASYTFTVEGGVYKISGRVIIPAGDSFWVRIPGAATQTKNHSSGWVRWSDPPDGDDWYWAEVFSPEDDNAVVEFTLAPGTHILEIAYRETGALLDAIVIESLD